MFFNKNNISVNLNKPVFSLFTDAKANVEKGICPSCSQQVKIFDFTDKLSLKEYTISGLCQHCQDEIFKAPECDE